MSDNQTSPRILTGKIISNKMEKTVVVLVERTVKHPRYGKIIKRRTKLHAHDENQIGQIGSVVKIQEAKPYSRQKSWVLTTII